MQKDLEKEGIKGIIYRVTSPSKRVYIGKTTKIFLERKYEHLYISSCKSHHCYNTKFSRAIRKYGDRLVWEVIEDNIPEQFLNTKECEWINKYNSCINGYNSTLGGDGGDTFSFLPNIKKSQRIEKFKNSINHRYPSEAIQKNIELWKTNEHRQHISQKQKEWWSRASKEEKEKRLKNWQKSGTKVSAGRIQSINEIEKRRVSNIEAWKNNALEREIRRQRFKEKNPWSLKGVMKRFNCSEEEAKKTISGKNKKAWETRKGKLLP